ncbi:MAG: hypothetical protein SXV54_00885 [Chloroflexota bacterium]|nr:hypothetical protein [Chloroflexota bacterium]
MLGHLDCYRRQVEYLPLLVPTRRYAFQRGLTLCALGDLVYLLVLRVLNRLQGAPFVARLTTALFAAGLADCAEPAFSTQDYGTTTTPLLQTKLYIPPVRPEMVSRPRLIERLNAGLDRKLTLISAPAGFGKTTLLSEWVTGLDCPVTWLSLDPADDDPGRFFAYLTAAVGGLELFGIGNRWRE